jgi:two-component system, LuxR family, sensor kinase FixL
MASPETLEELRSYARQRGKGQGVDLRSGYCGRSRATGASRPSGVRGDGGTPTDSVDAGTSQAELQTARTALAHASRIAILAEMSATVAHEVNQPLAAIVMGAEAGLRWLSRDDLDKAKVEKILRNIVSNARRASEIVERIRRVVTKDEPELVALDLNEVVEEALPLIRHELETTSVSLSATLGAGLPVVLGDRIQLQQVIVNLLINGTQAIAQGEGPARRIHLETGVDENDAAFVSIRDSGPGIAEENLDRVFDRFFTTKQGGMGIGLAICQSIITAHAGRIAVSNRPEGGAQFRVSIPAMRPASRPSRRGRRGAAAARAAHLDGNHAKVPCRMRLAGQAAVEGARDGAIQA